MLLYNNEKDLEQPFTQAAESILALKGKLTQDEMSLLYGLYKQTILGNNNTQIPSLIYQKERHKWHAWTLHRGKLKRIAREEYIVLVNKIITSGR